MRSVTAGNNQFCGPAVLSILTGKSVDECASVLSAISGRLEIREVKMSDMLLACKKLRFDTELVKPEGYSLFGQLSRLVDKPGLYIVAVKRHVVAVEVSDNKEIFFCDNHTKEPINAAAAARLGQRVEQLYLVTAKSEPVFVREELVVEKRVYATTMAVYVKRTRVFENSEDNVDYTLGRLEVRDNLELAAICQKLQRLTTGDN